MDIKEFSQKLALRKTELEQKVMRLGQLTKNEKNKVSMDFLDSIVNIQMEYSKMAGLVCKILPSKEVLDAYSVSQLSSIDFVITAVDAMIQVVINHESKKK